MKTLQILLTTGLLSVVILFGCEAPNNDMPEMTGITESSIQNEDTNAGFSTTSIETREGDPSETVIEESCCNGITVKIENLSPYRLFIQVRQPFVSGCNFNFPTAIDPGATVQKTSSAQNNLPNVCTNIPTGNDYFVITRATPITPETGQPFNACFDLKITISSGVNSVSKSFGIYPINSNGTWNCVGIGSENFILASISSDPFAGTGESLGCFLTSIFKTGECYFNPTPFCGINTVCGTGSGEGG